MENKDTEKAFKWIVGILEKHDVPFQVTGGLAARVYGSTRALNDIDIDISDDDLDKIFPDVEEHIIFGPNDSLTSILICSLCRFGMRGRKLIYQVEIQ